MLVRRAQLADAAAIALLEREQIEAELDPSQRGGVMTGQAFSAADIKVLIEQHWIVVAEQQGVLIGYVISGRWSFFESWPIYRRLLSHLGEHSMGNTRLSKHNCCQYGPIWIHPHHRGQGLFSALVTQLKQEVSSHYPFMLTFIAEENEHSFNAHTHKAAMHVVDFFGFDGRDYYLLACASHTSPK